MILASLRGEYHQRILQEIIRISDDSTKKYPNFADSGNKASIGIAWGIVQRLGHQIGSEAEAISGQTAGERFEEFTKDFLQNAFASLQHLRPGQWIYATQVYISSFSQYEHLSRLDELIRDNKELISSLGGDYIIKPDIVVGRELLNDEEINQQDFLVSSNDRAARHTPLRKANSLTKNPILHASISCKWTIRSDRSQNARTEALNLIRNRKGNLPHVVAVTAEPLPTRLSALALETGDLDCVYHFALYELQEAVLEVNNEDQRDMLDMLVEGHRLRDISDLPLDLAI